MNTICIALVSCMIGMSCGWMTLITVPDTQMYSAYHPAILEEEFMWICGCKDQLNIEYVLHVGDLVEHADSEVEWNRARRCMSCLHNVGLPMSISPGNHDKMDAEKDYPYRNFEGVHEEFVSVNSNGSPNGHRMKENSTTNHYYILDSVHEPGLQLLIVSLSYNTDRETTQWASSVLKRYEDIPAVILSHWAQHDCTNQTAVHLRYLAQYHCNVIMILGGHVYHCGGENAVARTNECGTPYYSIVQDYQGRRWGGSGTVRYYTLTGTSKENLHVCARTYNIYSRKFETDNTSFFSFDGSAVGGGHIREGCKGQKQVVCLSSHSHPGIMLPTVFMYVLFILSVAVFTYQEK
jgi:hypothetical protein